MSSLHTKPSFTSLVAFGVVLLPFVYVLSYAPAVRVCGRTRPVEELLTISGVYYMEPVVFQQRLADASLYPPYQPVDWLIDNTPLRKPLFYWAELWGVREQFEAGESGRSPFFFHIS